MIQQNNLVEYTANSGAKYAELPNAGDKISPDEYAFELQQIQNKFSLIYANMYYKIKFNCFIIMYFLFAG